jgi:hypothetical protein
LNQGAQVVKTNLGSLRAGIAVKLISPSSAAKG